ncbi:MAG: nicotinate phosphoribosyltransferase, partial [Moorellaceae bacterium]
MREKEITSLEQVRQFSVDEKRPFFSAQHEEIMRGATTDIYFVRTYEILQDLGLLHTEVTAEIFPRGSGILAGVPEVLNLLRGKRIEIWGLPEGAPFTPKEVVMRIRGPYSEFGLFETTILGILASSSGWATAAREVKEAAGDKPFICFGARHVHPAVAP